MEKGIRDDNVAKTCKKIIKTSPTGYFLYFLQKGYSKKCGIYVMREKKY